MYFFLTLCIASKAHGLRSSSDAADGANSPDSTLIIEQIDKEDVNYYCDLASRSSYLKFLIVNAAEEELEVKGNLVGMDFRDLENNLVDPFMWSDTSVRKRGTIYKFRRY